jgi:DNA polymerase-3 subunit epsilon/CBS domain-containing protein
MIIADIFDRFLAARLRRQRPRTPAHTPLEALKMVAIDSETTGLEVRSARIVSFAVISIATGLDVEPRPKLDLLVDPRVPIPAGATAIHGIDAGRVAGAPSIADVWDELTAALADRIVVGHHIGFDLAILAAEARRIGRPWREPASLDTAAMAAGLGLPVDRLDLVDLLARLGVRLRGERHTAAGDALMAADLFVAIAHRLRSQQRATLGGAVGLQRGPLA